ncbi:MAG: DUF6879 family protein [Micromonosporaceae bacterium]
MGRVLNDDEWESLFDQIKYTAFRLELQPAYDVSYEQEPLRRYLAGELTDPWKYKDETHEWCRLVSALTQRGGRMERVRVFEDPPTDYQRWLRWASEVNVAMGELQWYVTRQQAHDFGLLPPAGNVDWWLFDSEKLIQMHFQPDGQKLRYELVDDPATVVQANGWRDMALYHARRIEGAVPEKEVREQVG